MDVNGNGIGLQFVVDSVELFLKHRLGNYAPETTHEMFKDGALTAVKLDVGRPDAHIPSDRVEADIARIQDHAQRRTRPPQERLGARHEFRNRERFDEIIVGTGIEAAYTIVNRISSGQHEDRDPVAACSELCQEVETIAIGQAEIKDGGIVGV